MAAALQLPAKARTRVGAGARALKGWTCAGGWHVAGRQDASLLAGINVGAAACRGAFVGCVCCLLGPLRFVALGPHCCSCLSSSRALNSSNPLGLECSRCSRPLFRPCMLCVSQHVVEGRPEGQTVWRRVSLYLRITSSTSPDFACKNWRVATAAAVTSQFENKPPKPVGSCGALRLRSEQMSRSK